VPFIINPNDGLSVVLATVY